jgi:hypothetical protein
MTPAMRQYIETDGFKFDLELKKHENLEKFFREKYYLVSKFLDEMHFKKRLK